MVPDIKMPIIIANQLAAVDDNQAKKTAEDILRRILQNDSDNTDAMNTLAMLLQITGRLDEAAQLYQQLLTIQPDRVIAINNLAWILCEEKGQYEQALELAQQGLKIAPDYVDLIDTRGVAYYWLGDLDNAVKDFTRCVELYPEGNTSAVVSYLHLGMALEKLGQNDEAAENLNKALELNAKTGGLSASDFAEAQRLLNELAQKGV
jgi:tetratricopeptide (TPR) repeat protein